MTDADSGANNAPAVAVCRAANLTLEELQTLFPGGYRRGACRMAGLPYIP